MSECKWKIGDLAFDVLNGVVKLKKDALDIDNCYRLEWSNESYDSYELYTTLDGRQFTDEKLPRVITLEEAKARGFPVPKETKRIEIEVEWVNQYGSIRPLLREGRKFNWETLEGKAGKLIFEWIE